MDINATPNWWNNRIRTSIINSIMDINEVSNICFIDIDTPKVIYILWYVKDIYILFYENQWNHHLYID